MKNTLKAIVAGFAFVSFTACDNGETSDTSIDSATITTTTTEADENSGYVTATPGTYTELYTGKTVQVDKDAATGKWVDVSTRTPVEYYINVDTRDTFDMLGRNVNNTLELSSDGKYMVNERRFEVKYDSDGDMKAKSEDGTKIKYDASSDQLKMKDGDGNKVKLSEDKFKSKTDTSKTVIRQ